MVLQGKGENDVAKKATPKAKPAPKQTSDKLSSIAAGILGGKKATPAEIKALAGSVLSQDQTKGKRST